MAAFNEFNKHVMAEFHANGGKVGGRFADTDVLILTTTGAKTGQTRWNPLAYSKDGDRYVVVASKGGSPASPDWYHNLVANKSAVIEVGSDVITVQATIAEGRGARAPLRAARRAHAAVPGVREEHDAYDPGGRADAAGLSQRRPSKHRQWGARQHLAA